jgi:hypothetical protein
VLPLVLFNLFWLCVVVAGMVAVAVNWLSHRRAQRDAGTGARSRHRGRILAVSLLCSGLGFLILFNVAILTGPDPVGGTVTPAQITGTWRGSDGATLVLRPDGTFTGTRLPAHIGWVAPAGDPSDSTNPANVQGTWAISPGASGRPLGVTFCYDRRTDPDSCEQFGLLLKHASSSPALFANSSDPDDFSNQYAFSKQSG